MRTLMWDLGMTRGTVQEDGSMELRTVCMQRTATVAQMGGEWVEEGEELLADEPNYGEVVVMTTEPVARRILGDPEGVEED